MRMKTLIIIVTAIGVLAIAATVIIGTRTFEGIVVDKPYDRGLAWDREHRERRELGWRIDLKTKDFKTGENELVFAVLDRNRKPLDNIQVALTISRPSTAAYDRTYRSFEYDGTWYRARITFPLFGAWDFRFDISREGEHVSLEEEIFVQEK